MFKETEQKTTPSGKRENISHYCYFPDTRESALSDGKPPAFTTKQDGEYVKLHEVVFGKLVDVVPRIDTRDEKKPKLQVQLILQSKDSDGKDILFSVQGNVNQTTRKIINRLATKDKVENLEITLWNLLNKETHKRSVGVTVEVDGEKIASESEYLRYDDALSKWMIVKNEFTDDVLFYNPKDPLDPKFHDMVLINKCKEIKFFEPTIERWVGEDAE